MRDSEYIDLYKSILLDEQSLDNQSLINTLLSNLELIKSSLLAIGKLDQVADFDIVSELFNSEFKSQNEIEEMMDKSLKEAENDKERKLVNLNEIIENEETSQPKKLVNLNEIVDNKEKLKNLKQL